MPYFPPVTPGGDGQLTEYSVDPSPSTINQAWILNTILVPAGSPIGLLLGLTYSTDVHRRQVSYFTALNTTIRMEIPNGG